MLPLVWLVGASGVGKSTVGWELHQALGHRGTSAAFVDADQLRNVGGVDVAEDDLVADGLAAVEPAFRASGARLLIVAGLLDDAAQLARRTPGAARAAVLVIHLHGSAEVVVERVHRRGWNTGAAVDSLDYLRGFDAVWTDRTIDTTHVSASRVAEQLVQPALRHAASARSAPDVSRPAPGVAGRPAVLTGPGGVGVSTSGFAAFLLASRSGRPIGYVDSDQLGFVAPTGGSAALTARNAAAVAVGMAAHGVERVLIAAHPATAMEVVGRTGARQVIWLDASAGTLAARLRARAAGVGPPLVGDRRRGMDAARLRTAIEQSLGEAVDPSHRPHGSVVIGTDRRSPEEVAGRIVPLLR